MEGKNKSHERSEHANHEHACCENHAQHHVHDRTRKSMNAIEKTIIVFLAIGLIIGVFNQVQLFSMRNSMTGNFAGVSAASGGAAGAGIATGISSVNAEIIPRGTPDIYGGELGVSYDDVSASNPSKADATISVLGALDNKITLTGNDKERYVDITSQISCEYCCGAKSIIFGKDDVAALNKNIDDAIVAGKITENEAKQYRQEAGGAACGCAHSYAMRGLAKYLLTKHGSEYTNDEILEELGRWKTLFFPGNMMQKASVLKQQGIELNYINLASNKYRGIEQGASAAGGGSGMVGGC